MHVCMPCGCLGPGKDREGCQISHEWSQRASSCEQPHRAGHRTWVLFFFSFSFLVIPIFFNN